MVRYDEGFQKTKFEEREHATRKITEIMLWILENE